MKCNVRQVHGAREPQARVSRLLLPRHECLPSPSRRAASRSVPIPGPSLHCRIDDREALPPHPTCSREAEGSRSGWNRPTSTPFRISSTRPAADALRGRNSTSPGLTVVIAAAPSIRGPGSRRRSCARSGSQVAHRNRKVGPQICNVKDVRVPITPHARATNEGSRGHDSIAAASKPPAIARRARDAMAKDP